MLICLECSNIASGSYVESSFMGHLFELMGHDLIAYHIKPNMTCQMRKHLFCDFFPPVILWGLSGLVSLSLLDSLEPAVCQPHMMCWAPALLVQCWEEIGVDVWMFVGVIAEVLLDTYLDRNTNDSQIHVRSGTSGSDLLMWGVRKKGRIPRNSGIPLQE